MDFDFYVAFHFVLICLLSFYMSLSKVDVVVASAIIVTAVLGDSVLKRSENDIIRGCVDNITHGLIGAFSWCIVALHAKHSYSKYEIIVCAVLSSLVDIDHFIKAKSFHVRDALHQEERPFLHCSTIPLLIIVCNFFTYKIIRSPYWFRFYWILWTSFSSHHIRDANRRGLWFYPFGSTQPLSDFGYMLSTIVLPYLTAFLINNFHHSGLPYSMKNVTYTRTYFETV